MIVDAANTASGGVEASVLSDKGATLRSAAGVALKTAAAFWFLVAVVGQWIFVLYVMGFYGGAALRGEPEVWNRVLPHGYIAGDTVGNTALAVHLLTAVIITVGGPLQLVPWVRLRAPVFHHWNGRVYMFTAFMVSLSGLFMVWTRGTISGPAGDITISINAVLIMAFAVLALRYAIARDIPAHRRWALRLFMVVSGVWFFRVGLMLWLLIHQRPVGFDPDSFRGPFLTFLGLAQYLIPLAVLEIYFLIRDRGNATAQLIFSLCLWGLGVATGLGVFAATMGMWLPRL